MKVAQTRVWKFSKEEKDSYIDSMNQFLTK